MGAKRRRRTSLSLKFIMVAMVMMMVTIQLSSGQTILDDDSSEEEIETKPATNGSAASATTTTTKSGYMFKTREETDCDLETTSVSCMVVGARITRDIQPSDWAEGNVAVNKRFGQRIKRSLPKSGRGFELGFKIGHHDDDDEEEEQEKGWPVKEPAKKFGPFRFSFTRNRPSRKRPAAILEEQDQRAITHSQIPVEKSPPSQNYYGGGDGDGDDDRIGGGRLKKRPYSNYDRLPSYRPSTNFERPNSNYYRHHQHHANANYDRPSSNYAERPYSSYSRPNSYHDSDESPSLPLPSPSSVTTTHILDYAPPPEDSPSPYAHPQPHSHIRPSLSMSSHAQKSVPKSQTFVIPEEALLSLKFDEPADSQKPVWTFFPGSDEEDENEPAEPVPSAAAIVLNSNSYSHPTASVSTQKNPEGRPNFRKSNSNLSSSSRAPQSQSTPDDNVEKDKGIEMYIVAENGEDLSDLQEHLKEELELVNPGAVATRQMVQRQKTRKPVQKNSLRGGYSASQSAAQSTKPSRTTTTNGGYSTPQPSSSKLQRVKSTGGKTPQKIHSNPVLLSTTVENGQNTVTMATTTTTTMTTTTTSTPVTTATAAATATTETTATTTATTSAPTTSSPPTSSEEEKEEEAADQNKESSEEDIVIVDDGSFMTETQKNFGKINSNFTSAAAFVQSTMIQKKPVLKNTFLVKEEGMTCLDLCDPSPDGLGFALLGLCTPFYCKCQFEPNTQHVPMTCEPDHVFDPVKLTCNDPEDTALCSDDPSSLLPPPKQNLATLPVVQAVLPHSSSSSSAAAAAPSGSTLEMVPLLYYVPEQPQLVVNPSASSSKLEHYNYPTPPVVKTEQFHLPSSTTTQILKANQLPSTSFTQTITSEPQQQAVPFEFSLPERKPNLHQQFAHNTLNNHQHNDDKNVGLSSAFNFNKIPEPYGYLTVPPTDASVDSHSSGSSGISIISSQLPLTTRSLYKVQSPIPVIPNFPPRE